MRFELTQTLAASVEEVAAAYASVELYEALGGTDKLGPPEVLDRSEAGGKVTLRVRYAFVAPLPPAVTAVVDPKRLTWVEESVHDLAAGTAKVTLHPDHYADKLKCSGTVTYRVVGAGTRRALAGDLKVKVLLVGGQVERALVSGLQEHLDAEAPSVDAYLRG